MGLLYKNLKKVGKPPGAIIYTGEDKSRPIKMEVIYYNENQISKEVVSSLDSINWESSYNKWINIYGLNDTELIKEIGSKNNISSLILEDIAHIGQRPKIEFYDNYIFIVLKMLSFDNKRMKIQHEQISFILLPDTLITFQEVEGDVFDPVRKRIFQSKGLIKKKGVDYLLYCLIDSIVDQNFILLDQIEEKIEIIEEDIINNQSKKLLENIYKLRKELLILKSSVWPVKDIIYNLLKEDSVINDDTKEYLKDVNDHLIQIMDFIIIYREMISSLFDTHLSHTSNKMNQIMTMLTIFSAIFIPLTFLAGVYGMNFQYIPELSYRWSYPIFWFICIVTVVSMYTFFKYKKWL
ncbi:magnesium/cobalt transporter CorA [Thermohalobacter berrensis]|uniref:Magnesium transport protein CorA n=1 Tax=Thermohalobacter berrensis TaxID=99594 RepID=A0A419SU03_9FIRM|nr:magnesium/cobalt transporter CorA [Thermohalobacter berrensis]RKD28753.1 magnesium and cobalt transport protein CorA [Thermohalobacter berrensis]